MILAVRRAAGYSNHKRSQFLKAERHCPARSLIFHPLSALLVGICVFGGCYRGTEEPAARIVLIGLDGIDLRVINELIRQARLPTFARIMDEGVSGELESYRPMLSPLIWTTIATGRTPDQHRILGFSVHNARFGSMVVPSSRRRCAALWNIAPRYDLSSTVIGWWATWPAEEIQGFVISDRFARTTYEDESDSQLDQPGITYPEELLDELIDLRASEASISYETFSRYARVDREAFSTVMSQPFNPRNPLHHLRLILARAETYRRVLLHMLDNHPTDICLAYFEFPDSISHLFMPHRPPRQDHISPEEFDRFSGAVDKAYELADEILDEVLHRLGSQDLLLVVSDHGFLTGEERLRTSSLTTADTAVLWHRLEGTLLAHGDGIQPGTIRKASVYDITPTLLCRLGIPPSEEMPGRALPELLGVSGSEWQAPRRVSDLDGDYQPPPLPQRAQGDTKELERLRALGYVAGGPGDGNTGLEPAEHFNLAVFFEENNQPDLALDHLNRALELDPSHDRVLGKKCELLVSLDQLDEAEKAIGILIPRLDADLRQALAALAETKRDGAPNENLSALRERAATIKRRLAITLNNKGDLHFRRREFADAVDCFTRSNGLDPDSPETLYNLGTCYGITGRYREAVETLARLLELTPDHAKGRHSMAVALIRQGAGDRARPLLLSLVKENQGDANILYLVGESYRVVGDRTSAAQWYRRALDKDPGLRKARVRLHEVTDAQ